MADVVSGRSEVVGNTVTVPFTIGMLHTPESAAPVPRSAVEGGELGQLTPEPPRRVLVVVVPGEAGARIQAWREAHDPRRAQLLPPHLTLCYRAPHAPADLIEAQVRYAFPRPVVVRLGGVTALPNRDGTLVVEVLDVAGLDQARRRLFDATHAAMGGYREWPWHITWVRYGVKRDSAALLALAEHELRFDAPWTIDTVSLLELRTGRYEAAAEWFLG